MCIDILNMNFEFMLWITGIMDYWNYGLLFNICIYPLASYCLKIVLNSHKYK